MPKDRGVEQGDVDGPLKCILALGMVGAEAPLHVAARQDAHTLSWTNTHDPVVNNDFKLKNNKKLPIPDFQMSGSEKHIGAGDPQHALQENEGIADQWFFDHDDTQYWCCRTNKRSTPPRLEQNATRRQQKSFVMSQTWTQLLLSGQSTMFAH